MKTVKIWILNHYATLMYQEKAGRHYSFAKKLEERGYLVSVFCSSSSSVTAEGLSFMQRQKWIEKKDGNSSFIFIRNTPYKANGFDRIKNMFSFYKMLFPVSNEYSRKNGQPDLIIASSVHPLTLVAGIRIAKRFHIPCICEIRDLWPEAIFAFGKVKEKSLFGKVLVCGEHWIYRNANALIFTKEGDTDYLKERHWTTEQGGDIDLEKCFYINNGVDIPLFDYWANTEVLYDKDLLDESKFNVVYVGSIRPVNSVATMLDAALLLKKKGMDNIQFLIFGDGSQLPELSNRVCDEGLDNVKMKGRIPKKNIPFVLSKASIVILNYSQTEYIWTRGNSSNKLFEYLASGKPIISSVSMGYSIIKRNNCGIELQSCTPQNLADAIVSFYEMPKEKREQIGANARRGAEEFDFTVLTNKLEKVIESVTI